MNDHHWRHSMKRLMLVIGLAVTASAILIPSLAQAADPPKKLDVMLYVDTVNGSRPVGAKPRPVSCTQTNVYVRGEQQVFRVWGSVSPSGDILSSENVKYAYVTVPGSPNLKLSWGSHGSATNKVWFWAAAWNLPADAPLGEATAKIVFKTEDDSFGIYEYKYTVVPQLATTAKKTTTVKSR
jgi:hypothetical protein